MSNPMERLAGEMKATADALRNVRAQLARLVAEDLIDSEVWQEAYTTQVLGLDVIGALEKLAGQPDPGATRGTAGPLHARHPGP
jgi:hypothetical protein